MDDRCHANGRPTLHRCVLAAASIAALASTAAAETPHLQLTRTARPPALEDFFGTGIPAGVTPIDGFTQREPGDGIPVSEGTVAYVAYDQNRLYVVFVCDVQDRSTLRARRAPREAITADDQVAVLLDTFHDRRRSYLFAVNPLGIQADALLTEGQPDDYSYDTVWSSSGRLTTHGYVAWIAIPFKSLRLPPGDTQEWGIALMRSIPRNSEQSYWPAITRRVEGLAQQFATVDGLDGISPAHNVQLIPYGSAARASVRETGGAMVDAGFGRAGIDAKTVVRNALTVDLTVNPDFSQVESDQPQVTTNQRFEVFFPEKRPFFIENAGYFLYGSVPAGGNIPPFLFFSRRVADPSAGIRLTGKIGKWAVGALAINDRAVRQTDPHSPLAHVGITRVQREIAAQSSIGLLASIRTIAGRRDNRVLAADGRIKAGSNWVITMLGAMSSTSEAGGNPQSGTAVNVNINRTSRRVLYNVFYSDRSPTFRADLGFVPRTDIRQVEQYVEYRWHPSAKGLVALGPNSFFRFNWSRNGDLQDWIVRFPFQVDLKGRTSIFVRRVESGERVRGIQFREHLQTVNVQTEWLKWLAVTESVESGRSVNYFPPPGMAPTPASFLTASLTLTARTAPQFRTDLAYLFNRLKDVGGSHSSMAPIFDNHVARLTVNYQFTRALSARAIADYRAVLPDAARVMLTRSRRLTGDLLLTYLVQPGSGVYVGYTSAMDNGTRVSRQLFVKTSYLFRF